jgi:hypothetical protein
MKTARMEKRFTFLGARLSLGAILFVGLGFFLSSCSEQRKSEALPFGGVNAPVSGQRITGKLDVSGWALSETGIESVSIYVDRSFVSSCSTGLPRPDVAKVYPSFGGSDVAGWAIELDSTKLSPNWHELTVQAKSKGGLTRDLASIPILVAR